ncbi:hypothetical protein ABIB25_000029 [Nakamurella sp. UYEF19]
MGTAAAAETSAKVTSAQTDPAEIALVNVVLSGAGWALV